MKKNNRNYNLYINKFYGNGIENMYEKNKNNILNNKGNINKQNNLSKKKWKK